ncbi:hypothetical protein PHMEG_00098 [Phytophthora megakarya]|uniref:NADP-dependent oxidoreductase domain-containing protein n=1 Tax=Phytophthora megakarya TaxID=4795 RepID=A0A225X597_9STRA|nr:hypothetical protein PHMEG_00098 [Phytophthora megakarya]
MSTPTDCTLEQIADRVDHALETLQFQQLDVLLLQAQSLPETGGIYARKQAVLEAWENMMAIQRAGTVGHIGVSDLSMQDVDFLLTAYPNNPPEAWSMEIQLPEIASSSSNLGEPLQHVIAFAHAHSIDILARFPFERLETLDRDVEEEWSLLTQKIAERYRERPFKFLVAHENEGTTASYHMDSHALGDTKVMQTPLQIAVRYLLQKGLVIIPQSFDDLQRDNQAGKKTLREIFGPLAHPYAGIHSSFSPHKLYSSLLAREDLSAVDRALPLTTSFPLPTPPRSSTSKTARSRPGSTQERRTSLPVVSHLPSAE